MSHTLPELDAPPVNEVVCGVVLQPLALDALNFGEYWSRRRVDYPNKELKPPLGDADTLAAIDADVPPLRAWYITGDDTHVVQLQRDRLYVNWRARGAAYPRFRSIRPRLQAELKALSEYAREALGADAVAIGIELAKVNLLREGEHWNGFDDLADVVPTLAPIASRRQTDYPNFAIQFSEPRSAGETRVQLLSGREATERAARVLKMENRITAPLSDADDLGERFEAANEALNDLFAELIPRQQMISRFGGKE